MSVRAYVNICSSSVSGKCEWPYICIVREEGVHLEQVVAACLVVDIDMVQHQYVALFYSGGGRESISCICS